MSGKRKKGIQKSKPFKKILGWVQSRQMKMFRKLKT